MRGFRFNMDRDADAEADRIWPLPFGEQPRLEVECELGSVALVPVRPGEEPHVEAFGWDLDRLGLDVRQEGEVVAVHLRNPHENLITLHVPAGLAAKVRTEIGSIEAFDLGAGDFQFASSMGRVALQGLAGRIGLESAAGSIEARNLGPCDLTVATDAGQVILQNVSGRMRLESGAGQINGRGLEGRFDVICEAGSIRLEIDRLDVGEHRVRSVVGAIKIDLAPDLDVRVETRATMGSVRNRYPSRPEAATLLRVSTELGSIRVRQREGWFEGEPRPATPPTPLAPGRDSEPPMVTNAVDQASRPSAQADANPPEIAEALAAAAQPEAEPTPRESELERILRLVEAGQLSARDAHELLRALER
jgi:hypothetical protein